MRFLVFITLVFFGSSCFSKNYYLSNAGNDSNSGTSTSNSWKSINRLNKQQLKPGDAVFFRAGDKFIGSIEVKNSGNKGNDITYSYYGEGAKPILSGAMEINDWSSYKNNIWQATVKDTVYAVFINNAQQINARYPNTGLNKMDGGFNNKVSFTDNQLIQDDNYWVGANIRFRTWDWEFRKSKVVEHQNKKISIQDSSTNNLASGWGYFFDNKFSELDTLKEWYNNFEQNRLYLIPETIDFENQLVEAVVFDNAFKINKGVEYIQISGLHIEKYHQNGVVVMENGKNIDILNNIFEYINLIGINFDKNSQNCSVKKNIIKNINGRGISALEPIKILVSDNKITNIGSYAGYGISGVNGMIGIVIENEEVIKHPNSRIAKFNTISENKLDSIGYVGIRMDGAESLMENNVISNSLFQLSDGAAIYCWAKDGDYYTYNNTIKNNVVFNVKGNNLGTPSEENPIANGIYIDNNCYNINVENNTVFNSTGSGIHINSGAYNNTITRNNIYNCRTGISIAEWLRPSSTFGNRIDSNNVVATEKNQKVIELTNWLLPSTQRFASFNYNKYANLDEKYIFQETFLTGDKATKVVKQFSLSGWQNDFGYDTSSIKVDNSLNHHKFTEPFLIYNDTQNIEYKRFKPDSYYDLSGNVVGNLEILPFSSVILLKK